MDPRLSRREAGRRIVLTSAAGLALPGLAASAWGAVAQPARPGAPGTTPNAPPSAPPPPSKPSVLDKLLRKGRDRDWTLECHVHVDAYQQVREEQAPVLTQIRFAKAVLVFPAILGCASSETLTEHWTGEVRFDDLPATDAPVFSENFPCGTRLARWELRDRVGREVDISVRIPMRCWETIFDERAAGTVKWPGAWGTVSASALRPDSLSDSASPVIRELVKSWSEGKDPKTLPPVRLAKYLAGRVLEHVQPSGSALRFDRHQQLVGLELLPASITAQRPEGRPPAPHDVVSFLVAVYRAAGLPARTVIGYDIRESKGEDAGFLGRNRSTRIPNLKAWAEFALYDETAQKELWVPVDILRLRSQSSKAPRLEAAWKFFGTHDELDDVMPFAFHYHPPTTVFAYRFPAFWGWLPTPELPAAEQSIRFSSTSTPMQGGKPARR